jgi:hypothetical protein
MAEIMVPPDYVKNMGIAENYQKYAALSSGAAAMGELFGGMADYSVLRFRAGQRELQGRQAGLIAGQQSNLIMQKVMGDIQNSFATYAARGVTAEGTPMARAEVSLKEAGEDIKTLTETAKIQKEAAEFEASQLRRQANLQLFGGILQAVSGGARTYGMLKGGF